jgi:hypothetical protein
MLSASPTRTSFVAKRIALIVAQAYTIVSS